MGNLTEYLDSLKALEARATPGEWSFGDWSGQCHMKHQHGRGNCKYEYMLREGSGTNLVLKDDPITLVTSTSEYCELSRENAAFIAASRNALPKLIEALEEAVGALEEIDKRFYSDGCDDARTALSRVNALIGEAK